MSCRAGFPCHSFVCKGIQVNPGVNVYRITEDCRNCRRLHQTKSYFRFYSVVFRYIAQFGDNLSDQFDQDELDMLAPFLSMYDMVKRRSHKETEKEDARKLDDPFGHLKVKKYCHESPYSSTDCFI